MNTVAELVKVLGGVAGIVALIWRFVDEFGGWLRIFVKVENAPGGWSALTTVDNRGNRPKEIEFACLLVAPEAEDPVVSASNIASDFGFDLRGQYTNELADLKKVGDKPFYKNGRGIIPLPFYDLEQVDIADETLSYRSHIPVEQLGSSGPYSVRFFIFAKGRLHRSTQDLLVDNGHTGRSETRLPRQAAAG